MPRFCRPLGLSAISPYLHGRDLVAAQIIFLAKKDVSMYKTLKYNGSRIYGQRWDQLKVDHISEIDLNLTLSQITLLRIG